MSEVSQIDLEWLTVPSSDSNFKYTLERANAATIRAAIAEWEKRASNKTALNLLNRQLKALLEADLEQTRDTAARQDRGLTMEMAPLVAEREERITAEVAQSERERLIGQCHKAIGQVQTANMFAKFATVSSLVWLKDVKANKLYREIPGVGTWEKFCENVGMSRQKVDEDLANLSAFGEAFLTTCQQLSVGYRELRQLRQLTYDGESFSVSEDGKTVIIEGEMIPLGEDAAPLVESALEKLLLKNKELRDRNRKLEKDFKGAVKEEVAGFEAKEKALLKEVDRLKAFDPEEKDREWSVKQMAEIEKAAGEFVLLVQKFIIDPRFKEDRHLQALVSGHLQEAELALHDQRQRLDDIIDMFRD